MKLRFTLAAATILALPVAAKAQAINGLYVGAGAGANYMSSEHGAVSSATVNGTTDLKSRIGPVFVGSVGYGLGNGLRVELEGNYRYNSFYSSSSAGTSGGGQEQKFGAMVNVLYDFVGMIPVVQPYVGVGAGYEWAKETNLHVVGTGGGAAAAANTTGAFGYQAIVGAALPIAGAPGLAVTAEYRFIGLVGDRNYSGTATAGAVTSPATFKMSNDYNHSLLLGVRYAFGQAPAAPMAAPMATPAPAVQPARSYLVFVDWDKATLTDRARQIIKEAADNSTRVQYTQIAVNGYADTSGTPQYNQGLSMRRAQAVAAELVKDGVNKSAIAIKAFGDTVLLVQTGPGVREPQNRRVEIIIK
jgi:outer membrane protein OmpA-like peptidoglycan-associated protein